MKIWKLDLIDDDSRDGYCDCFLAFVIRAETEGQARAIAYAERDGNPNGTWLDPSKSTCEEVTIEGEPGVILGDLLSC